MKRLRVFEAAEKLNLSCEALAGILREMGYKVRGYSAYLSPEAFEKVKRRLREEEKGIKESLKRKRRYPFRKPKVKLDEKKIEKSVKETLRILEGRKIKRRYGKEQKEVKEEEAPPSRKISVTPYMSVAELAHEMEIEPSEVIKKCFEIGLLATINQRLDLETITLLASEFGFEIEEKREAVLKPEEGEIRPRPPVVTVMGHVDHGKTTLLDYIRKTKVAKEEPGQITQHTGAYVVECNGKKITFLDTPGHEAFTAMRARGAQVTDIVILVIAADDGVMPQTREALDHARAAGVPIIPCITKIDLPQANPERVKTQLAELGLLAEGYGGKTMVVEASGVTGEGVDDLLTAITLLSDELDLKARVTGRAVGLVIEARLDRRRGNLVTVLVQEGILKRGDAFVCGECYGRVRELMREDFTKIESASPSTPAIITGISGLPEAGERFQVTPDERTAREIARRRAMEKREVILSKTPKVSLQTLQDEILQGKIKELKVVLKADVAGTAEALKEALEDLSLEEVKIRIIHSGIGAITPSDVLLAQASQAIIVGFHTKPLSEAKELAEKGGVEIRLYDVIYKAIDELRAAMLGLLEPEEKEVLIGKAEVRQVFVIPKLGPIAGCYVTEGRVARDAIAKIYRDGEEIFKGKIISLKRFKEDVREVEAGYECGVGIEGLKDLKTGDTIEVFVIETVKREL